MHTVVRAEASLVGLDPLITSVKRKVRGHALSIHPPKYNPLLFVPTHLRVQISRVDQEILSAVQHQSSTGSRAR